MKAPERGHEMLYEQIKISVIVPVYNQKEIYLDECVSSICNQTYKNIEIILVDDGSSEPCNKLCDEYCLKDNRIKVLHKENGGTASARKAGIQAATGDYVAFVDSDDWIETNIYHKVITAIDENRADIVSYGYYRNYGNGEAMNVSNCDKARFCKKMDFSKEIFPYYINTDDFWDTELPLSGCCYVYKKGLADTVAQKIDEAVKVDEDNLFLLTALLNAGSACVLSYVGYHYRSHRNSKTHTLKNIKELLYRAYVALSDAIKESCYDEYTKNSLIKKYILFAYKEIMTKDYSILTDDKADFLFPYTEVRQGSRILVYGAGKLGKQIYNVVKSSVNYELVGLTDKNWKMYEELGEDVVAPESVLKMNYDYIIIAIIYAHIRKQVKRSLVEMGVPVEKIAEVDLNVLDEAHLPF